MIETEETKAEERQSVLPIAEEEPSLSVDNVVPAAKYSSYGLFVCQLILHQQTVDSDSARASLH